MPKSFSSDIEVRSYFASHYPAIFGASTRFLLPVAMHDVVDRFASELLATGNEYAVMDVRWRSMRLIFNPGTTTAQMAISQKYIAESIRISRSDDVYLAQKSDKSGLGAIETPSRYIAIDFLPESLREAFLDFLEAEKYIQPENKKLAYVGYFKEFLMHQFPDGAESSFSKH